MAKEREINFFELLENLLKLGMNGSTFICEKVKLSQEMNELNEALLGIIDELTEIVWRVNCRLKSVRQAVQLERGYSETELAWTDNINKLVISENHARTIARELRVAAYTTSVMKMTEDILVTMACHC